MYLGLLDQLLQGNFQTPELTKLLLTSVLSGKGKCTKRISRPVHSIAQDLTCKSNIGRKRTKKHVKLGLCKKRITASVDAVRWLNHFGHSISYDKINALETKLAKEQVNNQTNTSLVPTHIQPSVFVTFCFDNCDNNMESIYNATLYGTNGIIVQQLDKQRVEATENNCTIVSTERRRSFKPTYHELQPYIKEKERKNPIPIKQVDTNINQLDGILSRQEDLSLLILRYRDKDNQVMPGWKAFFYEITKETTDTHIAGYLPTICQSPTKMDVVLEVLKQYKQKVEALNLNETDLVLDHAIYAKAVEIVMNEKFTDLRTFINIRMGGFHAASIFLGVIGKRFKDAGLKDLIMESRLLGEDQVDQMLKGK